MAFYSYRESFQRVHSIGKTEARCAKTRAAGCTLLIYLLSEVCRPRSGQMTL